MMASLIQGTKCKKNYSKSNMRVCFCVLSHLVYCSLVVMDITLKVNPSIYPIVLTIFLFESPVLMAISRVELILWMGWARLPSPPTPYKRLLCFKARPYCPVDLDICHKQEEVLKLEHRPPHADQPSICVSALQLSVQFLGLPR